MDRLRLLHPVQMAGLGTMSTTIDPALKDKDRRYLAIP
jgi:hypothetical protein